VDAFAVVARRAPRWSGEIDLIDGAGDEIRHQCPGTIGGDRDAARLATERGAPGFLASRGVERDERAIRDVRDEQRLLVGRQRETVRLAGSCRRSIELLRS
jgi:hypothetical protein